MSASEKKTRGRPSKGAAARRHTISVMVTDEERDALFCRALSSEPPRSLADVLRDGALGPARGDVAPGVSRRA